MELDFNRLQEYFEFFTKNLTEEEELEKVKEEFKEFLAEAEYGGTEERIQEEGLDVMTALINYLLMKGLTQSSINKMIEKLNSYKVGKYGNKRDS